MARKKVSFSELYDKVVGPNDPMSREEFVRECKKLTDPHKMQSDLTSILMDRQKARTLAMYRKKQIDSVLS